ncbi:hypothetical protein CBR_g34690 [Chara braunii]|uniref:Reverse transcriptase domain-containing protein n=1 Tax=Chara braunii TaxID=69332 RepID=A0A388JYV7_CHABU|nr:hypothetical protein CBR_g34690 [Chara braunii]|eukprot:GBG62990.1 hypothetical protein CBR_g34690 [Chara braunii]
MVDSPPRSDTCAPYSPDVVAMIDALTDMGLQDAFRILWPHERRVTWVGPALKKRNRIDMAWLSQAATQCLLDFNIVPVARSDHKMIPIILAIPTKLHTRPPPSTVPGWIFSEERYCNMANQHWLYWTQLWHQDQSALQWLTDGTAALDRLLKQAVLASKRAQRLTAEAFIKRAMELGDGPLTEEGEEEWWMQWAALQAEWEEWQIKDAESWGLRNKAQWKVAVGHMTKTFFRRLHFKRPASMMVTLQAPFQQEGPLADNTQDILQFSDEFYSYLLTEEQSWPSEEMATAPAKDIWQKMATRLSDSAQRDLDEPINEQEICEALAEMPSGKAPGPDGMPVEHLKACVDTLLPHLLEGFNDVRTPPQGFWPCYYHSGA